MTLGDKQIYESAQGFFHVPAKSVCGGFAIHFHLRNHLSESTQGKKISSIIQQIIPTMVTVKIFIYVLLQPNGFIQENEVVKLATGKLYISKINV